MKYPFSWVQDVGRLMALWLAAIAIGTLWALLDRSVPAWDQAEHLSLAMNHWWAMTHNPAGWTAEGLRDLWLLTPKYPPVFYWVTAGVHSLVGPGPDQALLANAGFALVLLIATYGLGRHLFSPQIGLLAAGLVLLMPRLIRVGLDYQLDYAVTALVTLSFWCLTVWREAPPGWRRWGWMLAFGVSYGLALMTKQSALLFLVVPLLWVTAGALGQRHWGRLLQLGVGAIATGLVMLPWLSVNWVFQLSIVGNTNVRSAQVEGDPMLNTVGAWIYYWRDLPAAVSWGLLLVPLVGLALWGIGVLPGRRSALQWDGTPTGRAWLLTYGVGAYVLWSAIVNKDPRYIAPLLPALAVFLAWGLACWWRKWPWVSTATVGVAAIAALLNLFPLGGAVGAWWGAVLAPQAEMHPYLGPAYPHLAVVAHVAQAQPYQIATLGGLQSTAAVNQHNISYFGKLQDYQVYGRQVGSRASLHDLDLRSLSWFYAQGPQNQPWPPTGEDVQATIARRLAQHPDFMQDGTWDLPDQARLYLYRRRQLPVTVAALPDTACPAGRPPRLSQVLVPAQVPPGQPVPVTYEWVGQWQTLWPGLGLLTWEPVTGNPTPEASDWIHDHGIGLGTLRPNPIQANQRSLSAAAINPQGCFQVTERTATLPPAPLSPGEYRLVGTYVNTADNTSQTLELPVTTVRIDPNTPPLPAPDLDWVTQLREIAKFLPQGPDYLDEVFDPIGRINLYDPIQNYTVQAERSLQLRWQAAPTQVAYGYGLALAQVLQLNVKAAIATLAQLAQVDADNPYVHAYLGFVNIYAGRPRAAQAALEPALRLAPDAPEIQGLSAVAALLQGRVWQAWQQGQRALALLSAAEE